MPVTFEQLQKANDAIRTMTLTRQNKKTGEVISKEYAEVNQRVKAFRMVYPNGRIVTEMVSNEGGICIFRATIYDGDGTVLSTGTAFEKQTASMINQTSYIENCETSATGRALGFAGFGIDTSIASYEEVKNAQSQQDSEAQEKPHEKTKGNTKEKVIGATQAQKKLLSILFSDEFSDELKVWLNEKYGICDLAGIDRASVNQASDVIKWAEGVVKNWWKNENTKDSARSNMLKKYGINDIGELDPDDRMDAAKVILKAK